MNNKKVITEKNIEVAYKKILAKVPKGTEELNGVAIIDNVQVISDGARLVRNKKPIPFKEVEMPYKLESLNRFLTTGYEYNKTVEIPSIERLREQNKALKSEGSKRNMYFTGTYGFNLDYLIDLLKIFVNPLFYTNKKISFPPLRIVEENGIIEAFLMPLNLPDGFDCTQKPGCYKLI